MSFKTRREVRKYFAVLEKPCGNRYSMYDIILRIMLYYIFTLFL